MKLFHSPTSPYVRKIMVLLQETGHLEEIETVEASGTPYQAGEGVVARNPLGKIPALERGDGPTIYDSRVICQYLDDRFASGLYGTGNRRWEVLTLEATGDGMTDAALLMTYETRLRPEDRQHPDFADAQWRKIAQAAEALNQRWMAHLAGPLCMGQISVACALAYADFRHGQRDWRSGNEALADWFKAFSDRPSMQATVPPA